MEEAQLRPLPLAAPESVGVLQGHHRPGPWVLRGRRHRLRLLVRHHGGVRRRLLPDAAAPGLRPARGPDDHGALGPHELQAGLRVPVPRQDAVGRRRQGVGLHQRGRQARRPRVHGGGDGGDHRPDAADHHHDDQAVGQAGLGRHGDAGQHAEHRGLLHHCVECLRCPRVHGQAGRPPAHARWRRTGPRRSRPARPRSSVPGRPPGRRPGSPRGRRACWTPDGGLRRDGCSVPGG